MVHLVFGAMHLVQFVFGVVQLVLGASGAVGAMQLQQLGLHRFSINSLKINTCAKHPDPAQKMTPETRTQVFWS